MKDNLKLTDLPESERPREKLFKYGVESLTNIELLALVLRNGTRGENIINLCSRILKESGGLNGLLNLRRDELMSLKGIKEAKVSQLLALVEISKRINSYKGMNAYKISTPKEASDLVMDSMRYLKQEVLKILCLNTKNVVIKVKDIFVGGLNSSIVHPREVFGEAIREGCASIIVCHNHPSGDPAPSVEDINVTKRLKECGNLLGIDLLDHVIIGNGSYISLKDKGII